MNEKSHVATERRTCEVCGGTYETGANVVDGTLRLSMPPEVVTGWGLCPTHDRLYKEGFIALVECDPTKSGYPSNGDTLSMEDAYRTGVVAHVKREVFEYLCNRTIGAPCVFVPMGLIDTIQRRFRLH